MLSCVRSTRRRRNFLVYDLEWIPGTLEVRCVGVYDGQRYRWYKTVEAFLDGELIPENRGKWFYAHAGGLADIQFLFEKLVEQRGRWRVQASFSGSSAIIVHVGEAVDLGEMGRGSSSKSLFHFVDSYWLLRDTLKNIGKSIGMAKGGAELSNDGQDEAKVKAWFKDVSLRELVDYNEQDCVILWTAIDQFQDKLWSFGGQLQMTIASSAMQLFRRVFLRRDIPTSDAMNDISRMSYVASRVEVFDRWAEGAYYYDVNSSFPYSMTKPLPGRYVTSRRGSFPKHHKHYLAELEIEVPDCHIPPLPMRAGGRIFFPVGRWKGWFNNIDKEFLEECGGRILRIGDCHAFEAFHDLEAYVNELYARRKASTDDFERYCYKLLLNALYGKFAESDCKQGMTINPTAEMMRAFDPEVTQMLLPGVFLHPAKVDVPHMHVPISSHITAYSRGPVLTRSLMEAREPHYADTDGFSNLDPFPSGKDLGALKLEKYQRDGLYIAPKLYQQHGVELKNNGQWEPITVTKAKGFSLGRDKVKAEERFNTLTGGGEVEVTRMERIRTIMREALEPDKEGRPKGLKPRETTIKKRLQKHVMGKRFMYPDGKTRPWTVEELRAQYGE